MTRKFWPEEKFDNKDIFQSSQIASDDKTLANKYPILKDTIKKYGPFSNFGCAGMKGPNKGKSNPLVFLELLGEKNI